MQSKRIKGFEDRYSITPGGRIWSFYSKKWLQPSKRKDGYMQVCLRGGQCKYFVVKVHRLVAITFIPNPLDLPQVNHISGNKIDNRVTNLEWCTASYNMTHAASLGKLGKAKGERNGNHKLTTEQVKEIRQKRTLRVSDLCKQYRINKTSVSRILSGKAWATV